MKYLLIVAFVLLYASNVHAQKITIDRTDPVTKIRSFTSSPVTIKKASGATCMLTADFLEDSLIQTHIAFIIPDSINTVSTADSTAPFAYIQIEQDSIIACPYESDSKIAVEPSAHLFSYRINAGDRNIIQSKKITNVTFYNPGKEGGNFDVDNKAQDKIGKTLRYVIKKGNSKTANPGK